jgi:hypothetical protein
MQVGGHSVSLSTRPRGWLAPKQQALIFGHAVPMPVAFQPREYGSTESYKHFSTTGETDINKQAEQDIDDLFGENG